MTIGQAIEELADAYAVLQNALKPKNPGVQFGAIESLGYWQIPGSDGKTYDPTSKLPSIWRLSDVLGHLTSASHSRGVEFRHFHVDFGYEGALYDGGGATLNMARIQGANAIIKANGLDSGLIVNAYHKPTAADPTQSAVVNTLEFARATAGSVPSMTSVLLQTWQPYPVSVGPETDSSSIAGLALRAIEALESTSTPSCSGHVGMFMSDGNTIYYSNGSAYCSYESWSDYLKAGGPPDTTSLKRISPIPACWSYDGGCVVN